MAGQSIEEGRESAGGGSIDYQSKLDSIAESIRKIQQPVDGDDGKYGDVGLNGSMLEAMAAVGKMAGSVFDGVTGQPIFSTAYEAAEGLGEDLAGNKDAANEHYVAAVGEMTEDGMAGAAVAIHRTIEHIKDGEWSEAIGDAADAVGDIVGTVTSPIAKTIENVAESIGYATELFGQGSKMADNAAQDANYALAVENNAAMRDDAVARLQEQYAEIVEQARQSGYEPALEKWHNARGESAALGDSLGLRFDPIPNDPILSPMASEADRPSSYESLSPSLPGSEDIAPPAEEFTMPPLGALEEGGSVDTVDREPASAFGTGEGEGGLSATPPIDGDVAASVTNEAGTSEAGADVPAAAASDVSATLPVSFALPAGNSEPAVGGEIPVNDGPSVLEELLEELNGVQDFDLTDNVEVQDLTQSPLSDLTQNEPTLETAVGVPEEAGGDWSLVSTAPTAAGSDGGDWSASGRSSTGDTGSSDWGTGAGDSAPLNSAFDSSDSADSGLGDSGGVESAPTHSGPSSADSGDSGSGEAAYGTVV
ncbi:MAG: hypothetical protein ACKODL_06875 [Phenylobacterium sp.]